MSIARTDPGAEMQITPKEASGDACRRMLLSLLKKDVVSRRTDFRYSAIIYEAQRLGDFLLASNSIAILLKYFGEENCALVISPESLPLAKEYFPKTFKIIVPLSLTWGGYNIFEAARLKNRLVTHSTENLVCMRHHRSPVCSFFLRCFPANISIVLLLIFKLQKWGFTL